MDLRRPSSSTRPGVARAGSCCKRHRPDGAVPHEALVSYSGVLGHPPGVLASALGVGPPDPWGGPPTVGGSEGGAFAGQLHQLSVAPRPLTPAEVARDARASR